MSTTNIWTVTCDKLYIRSEPSLDASPVGIIKLGDQLYEEERTEDGSWIKVNGGWCQASYLTISREGNANLRFNTKSIKTSSPPTVYATDKPTQNPSTPGVTIRDQNSKPDDTVNYESNSTFITMDDLNAEVSSTNSTYTYNESEFAKMSNIAGVFGLPYQFLPDTDLRIGSDSRSSILVGSEYAERIIERMPMMMITPGRASFMRNSSLSDKRTVLEYYITSGYGQMGSVSINDLIDSTDRYYSFSNAIAEYYRYVNPMCRIAAVTMGVDNIALDGTLLGAANWHNITRRKLSTYMDWGTYTAIPFYIDADSSISESFGNSTTQSMLASAINSLSDMGRELNFLFGNGTSNRTEQILSDPSVAQSVQNVNDIVNGLVGGGSFFSNLATQLTTVAAGGRLMFPEIWADSSFSRSYTFDVKLMSPDPSPLSVYLNVIVPLLHLLGFVLPQSPINDPNSYMSPFIIRAMYKGFFNVDMGIITDMSVTRGAECQWTPNGVPTSVNVSVTIKDLYQCLSMTPTSVWGSMKYSTVSNLALMDYISTLCGVNVYKADFARIIEVWYKTNFGNILGDAWGNFQNNIHSWFSSNIGQMWERMLR
ncbi:MAG: SH3 domain-containing protein [Lachnospiraceae bacterium]|nr:SH3 domain-containing protein [Lachnospiraceae bacterium]